MFASGVVGFSGTLTNQSSAVIWVSATDMLNIEVIGARFRGREIIGSPAQAGDRFVSPYEDLENLVQALQPGQSVTFPIAGVQTILGDLPYISYSAPGPGSYSVRFRYQYGGSQHRVFAGTVDSNEVKFDLY